MNWAALITMSGSRASFGYLLCNFIEYVANVQAV